MYILAPNGQSEKFPYSIGALRKDNPQTSFPKNPTNELLASWNVFPVADPGIPAHDPATQVVDEFPPVFANGRWERSYAVRAKTQAELDSMAAGVRAERNEKLRACDWTQIADSSADKPAWLQYRAALRAIPQQPGFPTNVTWPTEPTVTP